MTDDVPVPPTGPTDPGHSISRAPRPGRRAVLLGGLWALAGCASVPTSGAVRKVHSGGSAPRGDSIDVAPQPPAVDGTPELILAGFLQSMSGSKDGYRTARSYLTEAAARTWQPTDGTTIYDASAHKPVTTATSATLKAPIVARLDAEGHHTPVTGQYLDHDFGLVKVDGQWRISAPPPGILISQFTYARGYTSVPVYFLGRHGGLLVPEIIHLPHADATPTGAVRAIFAGPSRLIAGAVVSAVPSAVGLASAAVSVDAYGVATVALNSEAARMTDSQRRTMAAQVMWTLSGFSQVSRVRFSTNGATLSLPGSAEDDTVSATMFSSMSALPVVDSATVAAVRDGHPGRVGDGGTFTELAGSMGPVKVGTVSCSRSDKHWALVSAHGDSLWSWTEGDTHPVRLGLGSGLLRPQVLTDASIWTIGREGQVTVVHAYGRAGARVPVDAASLASRTVLAFSVSPDLARLALVLADGSRRSLAMATVSPAENGAGLRIGPPVALGLSAAEPNLVTPVDLGWVSATSLIVLAKGADGAAGVPYWTDLDGSSVSSVGPLTGADMVTLATLPRTDGFTAAALTSTGQVLRYEDRYRWRAVAAGATAVAITT